MAFGDQCSVANDEGESFESLQHDNHARLGRARRVEEDMAAQGQSAPSNSTEGRIAIQTRNTGNSLRPPLHDASDSASKLTNLSASVTQTVFETAELLEMIILFLHPKDILTVQQVGREWRDAVNGSLKLKRKLGIELDDVNIVPFYSPLDPDPSNSSVFPCFFFGDRRRQFRSYTDESFREVRTSVPKTLEVGLMVGWPGDRHKLRVGSRCRTMRLCHPPLKCATIEYSRQGSCLRGGGYRNTTLDKPDGITVGDVLDAAEGKYLEAKSLQPPIEDVSLFPCGSVQLSEHDPIVQEREAIISQAAACQEEETSGQCRRLSS